MDKSQWTTGMIAPPHPTSKDILSLGQNEKGGKIGTRFRKGPRWGPHYARVWTNYEKAFARHEGPRFEPTFRATSQDTASPLLVECSHLFGSESKQL